MVHITIDDKLLYVKEDISVLDATIFTGLIIPRFCYHEKISPSGNCRMCILKIVTSEKFFVACTTDVMDGMDIISIHPLLIRNREDILEMLLINHPLDCPICDEAGECDLQDQATYFGVSITKFYYNKNSFQNINFNTFIKGIMSRCIHCTRCIRYNSEIAGVDYFGLMKRGELMEIRTYTKEIFNSELSGGVIDLCPVGALTARQYEFKMRSWELETVESIDIMDSLGAPIYIYLKESQPIYITPKYHKDINPSEDLSDKSRFCLDILYGESKTVLPNIIKRNNNINNILKNNDFFLENKNINAKKKILFLINEELSLENLIILKKIKRKYNNIEIKTTDKSSYDNKNLNYFSPNSISILNEIPASCFLIMTNPRIEVCLINLRLKLLSLRQNVTFYNIGQYYKSNLHLNFINFSINFLLKFCEGKINILTNIFINSNDPILIFGSSILKNNFNISFIKTFFKKIKPDTNFLYLYNYINTLGSLYTNIKKVNTNDIKKNDTFFLINLNENIKIRKILTKNLNKIIFWFNVAYLKYKISTIWEILIKNSFEDDNHFITMENKPQKINAIHTQDNDYKNLNEIMILLFNITNLNKYNFLNFYLQLSKNYNFFNNLLDLKYYFNIIGENNYNKIYSKFNKLKFSNVYLTNYISYNSKSLKISQQIFNHKILNIL